MHDWRAWHGLVPVDQGAERGDFALLQQVPLSLVVQVLGPHALVLVHM